MCRYNADCDDRPLLIGSSEPGTVRLSCCGATAPAAAFRFEDDDVNSDSDAADDDPATPD